MFRKQRCEIFARKKVPMKRLCKTTRFLPLLIALICLSSCKTILATRGKTDQGLALPYLKNVAGECYYVDEFMPVPNALVSGKSGALKLRYYTYNSAFYKDWPESRVILSFYSSDEQCWSLFEEYSVLQ